MGDDYRTAYKKPSTAIQVTYQTAVDPWERLAGAVILAAFDEYRHLCREKHLLGREKARKRHLEEWLMDDSSPFHRITGITSERIAKGLANLRKNPHQRRSGVTIASSRTPKDLLTCQQCGQPFKPYRPHITSQRYCSPKCSSESQRKRK